MWGSATKRGVPGVSWICHLNRNGFMSSVGGFLIFPFLFQGREIVREANWGSQEDLNCEVACRMVNFVFAMFTRRRHCICSGRF